MTVNLLAPHKFSLSLLLDSAHRIIGVDVGAGHENKHTDANKWVNKTHEHIWTDLCHGGWARDLDPFPAGIAAALAAFCARHRIAFTAVWSDPPAAQLGLDL